LTENKIKSLRNEKMRRKSRDGGSKGIREQASRISEVNREKKET
jgi:hypothetical protein